MLKIKLPITILFAMLMAQACVFPALAQTNEEESSNGRAYQKEFSKAQIQALISPYKFGRVFHGKWRFNQIEKSDAFNIVFSIRDHKGNNIFIWLTAADKDIWNEVRTKRFNIIAVKENGKKLSHEEKQAADRVFQLIKKNDAGGPGLRKAEASQDKGLTVVINKGNPAKRSFNTLLIMKVGLLFLFLVAATIVFIWSTRKLKRGQTD